MHHDTRPTIADMATQVPDDTRPTIADMATQVPDDTRPTIADMATQVTERNPLMEENVLEIKTEISPQSGIRDS